MSERTPSSIPALPPPPASAQRTVRHLGEELASRPSTELLAAVPWDGPRLDPDVLTSHAMLAWLR